jgi:hypothetical protein
MKMSFSTDPDLYVPRVVTPLDAYELNECTSKQRVILRTVFAMINGQRSIGQIKGQLHLSSKVVDEALAYMQWLGVLE